MHNFLTRILRTQIKRRVGLKYSTTGTRKSDYENSESEWFQDAIYNSPLIPVKYQKKPSILKKDLNYSKEIVDMINELEKNAGIDLLCIDVSSRVDHCDYVIICTARSERHLYSLADSVRLLFKHSYVPSVDLPDTLALDGRDSGNWIVLDLGRVILHCVTAEKRLDLDLDNLWSDLPEAS